MASWPETFCEIYNLTPYKLSKITTIPKSTIYSAIDNGSRIISLSTAKKLAKGLNINLDTVLKLCDIE